MKPQKDLFLDAHLRYFSSDGLNFNTADPDNYNIVNRYQPPVSAEFQQPKRDHNLFFKAKYKNVSMAYFHRHFDEGNGRGMGPDFYLFSEKNKWKTESDLFWTTYEKSFQKNDLFTIDFSYLFHKQSPETQFFKWRTPGDTSEAFSQYMTGLDKTFRSITSYSRSFSKRFRMIAGVEFEHTKSIPPYANDEVLGTPARYEGADAASIREELTIKETRWAGYGQATYSPVDWCDIILGGRYDYSTSYNGTFNPRLGLILRPSKKTSLKLLYGSAFQAPALFYRYEQFGTPLFVFRSTGEIRATEDPNWELKNQRLHSYEAAVYHKFSPKFWLTLSVYSLSLHDLIQRVTYDSTGSTWNKYFNIYTDGQRNENIGEENVRGLNLTVNSVLGPDAEGYLYYSFTKAKKKMYGTSIPSAGVSPHKLWIGFTFRNLFKFITLSPRFKWVGPINTEPTNTLYAGAKQPGFTSLDLGIRIAPRFEGLRIIAFIGNLLGNRIRHAGLFQQTAIYAPDIPQPGFHFRVGFEFDLLRKPLNE